MNISEKLKSMIDRKQEGFKGAPNNPGYDIAAEAEAIVRGPDGKIKSRHTANKTEITL